MGIRKLNIIGFADKLEEKNFKNEMYQCSSDLKE
jgi:hypothetical protein